MLPVTPTADWNTIPNRRRIISPGESIQPGINNNNNNPFGLLEDSDDESISSVSSVGTATALETIRTI